jgi:N-acetyl-anhydromuramyl-L-alanine amidase AmpD
MALKFTNCLAVVFILGLLTGCASGHSVLWDDTQLEGLSIVDAESYRFDGEEGAGYETWPAGAPDDLTFGALTSRLSFVVLYTARTETVAEAFETLQTNGQSTHFIIDGNGTVYQTLDLTLQANQNPRWDAESITIHLTNPLPDLAGGEGVGGHLDRREVTGRVSINGALRQSLTYTPAQHGALAALLRDLNDTFPGVAARYPATAVGEVIPNALALDPNSGGGPFRGVVAHWHLDSGTWAPGPGLDWSLLDVEPGL